MDVEWDQHEEVSSSNRDPCCGEKTLEENEAATQLQHLSTAGQQLQQQQPDLQMGLHSLPEELVEDRFALLVGSLVRANLSGLTRNRGNELAD